MKTIATAISFISGAHHRTREMSTIHKSRAPRQSLRRSGCIIRVLLVLSAGSAFASDGPAEKSSERDAELILAAGKAAIVKQGKASYVALCQSCHGDQKVTGDAPSNLFDTKWYHGGRPSQIEQSIRDGFLEKGMPPWRDALPPEDVVALTAFLLNPSKP